MRLFLFPVLLLISFGAAAQTATCDCPAALRDTWAQLQPLPAFRDHCPDGTCAAAYAELYTRAPEASGDLACYRLLTALVATLGDNHTAIYGAGPDSLWVERAGDGAQVPADPRGERYLRGNDQYELILPPGGGEGILRTGGGDTLAYLTPLGHDRYRFSGHRPGDGRLISYPEQIRGGSFHQLGLRRDTTERYFSRYGGEAVYAYRQRSSGVGYLRLGSFRAFQPTLGEAENFYAGLPDRLAGDTLIVDLRDNPGGGDRNSNLAYRILKRHRKQYDAIYVLINHGTTSNAEQFALRMSRWPVVTLAGEATRGMLSYELEGKSTTVGCGRFVLQMATRRHRRYLPYEGRGVPPDVRLPAGEDWVEGVLPASRKE